MTDKTFITPGKFRHGWKGPDKAQREWDKIGDRFASFFIAGQTESSEGKRVVGWDFTRQVNGGEDLFNRAQEIGSCVGHGAINVVNYTACYEIVALGESERYREGHVPYAYGTGRVQIGGGRLGNSDGSLGSWQADAVQQFGILATDEPGVPPDDGKTCKLWGRKPGPPMKWIRIGKKHLIKTVARIHSYTELRDALANGHWATIASNRGFAMKLKFDKKTGKHWFTGRDSWAHQMSLIGLDDDPRRPGIARDNSWGSEIHGPQKDGPDGMGWQDAEDIDRELRKSGTECFAFSRFVGYPAQKHDYLLG